MSANGRLFPWPTFGEPVGLTVDVAAGGLGLPARYVDRAHRRIEVDHGAPRWSQLDIELTAALPDAGPRHPHPFAHAVVTCVATASRLSTRLEPTASGWSGMFTIDRDEVQGAGTLEVVLTSDVRIGEEPVPVPSRLLGTSETWTIRFDAQHGPPGHARSPMRAIWEDFGKPTEGAPPELGKVKQSLSYCDVVPAEPVLYLNLSVAGLQALLDDTHATGRRRQVQQHLGASIALDVVLALVDAAIHQIPPLEGGLDPSGIALSPALTATLHTVVEECEDFVDYADLVRQVSVARAHSDADELNRIRALLRSAGQACVGSRRSAEALIKGVSDD